MELLFQKTDPYPKVQPMEKLNANYDRNKQANSSFIWVFLLFYVLHWVSVDFILLFWGELWYSSGFQWETLETLWGALGSQGAYGRFFD